MAKVSCPAHRLILILILINWIICLEFFFAGEFSTVEHLERLQEHDSRLAQRRHRGPDRVAAQPHQDHHADGPKGVPDQGIELRPEASARRDVDQGAGRAG